MALLGTNLKCFWPFTEAEGVDTVDIISGRNLTDVNAVGSAAGLVYNDAKVFDSGTPNYLTIDDHADLSLGGDISFEFALWVKFSSVSALQFLFAKDNVIDSRDYSLCYIEADGKFYFECSDGSEVRQVSSDNWTIETAGVTPDIWYLVSCGRDAATNEIYILVDAIENFKTTAASTNTIDGSAVFQVGARQGISTFDGMIGPVMFWKNRSLDEAERNTLYNAGSGIRYSVPIISSNGGGPTAEIEVEENNGVSVTTVETSAGFDLTYLIEGVDAASFFIGSGGELEFSIFPDFEDPLDVDLDNIYEVTAIVSSPWASDSQAISVEVTNDEGDDEVGGQSTHNQNSVNLAMNSCV